MEIKIASKKDAADVLALQKRAYMQEAQIYNNFSIQPLVMTLEETLEEFKKCIVIKAVEDDELVGSARVLVKDGCGCVYKVIVAPEFQNKGIGKQLMLALEKQAPGCKRFELFTGYKSEKNIAFYQSLGYKIFKEEEKAGQPGFVYMEKIINGEGEK